LNRNLAQINRIFKAISKIAMVCIAIVLLLLLSAVFSLRISSVNQFVTQHAVAYTSKLIGYPVSIGSVNIDWYDHIILKDVVLKDREKNDMIYLGEGHIDYSFYKVLHGEFEIEQCVVKNGGVSLYNFASDNTINLVEFTETLQAKFGDPNDTASSPFVFRIPYAKLYNMKFRYIDQTEKIYQPRFDENHFGFDSVYSYVQDFEIRSDTIQLYAKQLRTVEFRTRKEVKELTTFFQFHEKGMLFENAYAHVGNSTIHADVAFHYDSIGALTDFTTLVKMDAVLDNCHIDLKDIALFSNALDAYDDRYTISGKVSGTVNRLKGKDLDICFGKKSYLKGNASFKNLPDIENLFIDCSAKNVLISIPDLKQYVDKSVYTEMNKFQYFAGHGKFVGLFHDFITQGVYATALGTLKTDLYLNLPDRLHPNAAIELTGQLETNHFKIGVLIDHPAASSISLKGEINATGKTIGNATVKLDAFISSFVYSDYNYKNIITKARLSNRMFNGYIAIKDSNLLASLNGTIDFREDWKLFNVTFNCEKANLYNLNLGTADKFPLLKTSATLNIKALNLTEIEGELFTGKTYLRYPNNKEVYIDSIHAEIHRKDGYRLFTLESDLIDGSIKGNFDFIGLQNSMVILSNEILLKLKNKTASINQYYTQKTIEGISSAQEAEFTFQIDDINQFFDIYMPGTFMTPDSKIEGTYLSNASNNKFECSFVSDTLFYNNYEFRKNKIDISLSKHPLKNNITVDYDIISASQKFKSLVPTKNMYLHGNVINDSLILHSTLEQDSINSKIVLNNVAVFKNEATEISFDSSYIKIEEEVWNFNEDGIITIANNGDLSFEKVSLNYINQQLSLNGVISNDPEEILDINIDNFNINTILSFFSSIPIKGNMNGDMILSNLLNIPNFKSEISIDDLEIDEIVIGNLEGKSKYNNSNQLVEVDFDIYQNSNTVASVNGYLNANNPKIENDLSLLVDLSETDLAFLNPLLEGILENIEGSASGSVSITGKYSDPVIFGETYVDHGKFKIPYLGTTYSLNDNIIFNDNLIGFTNVKLKDQYNKICVLNGGIYHDLFQNFVFNLKGDMQTFQVLHTTEKDNPLFYGTAFATGQWEFLGTEDNIRITADANMLKTSKIYIPMDSYSNVEDKEYIEFITKDTLLAITEKKINLSGINLELNINVEQGTYSEIIFDKQTGDIIKSYGGGALKFNVDTRGDFSMYGTYFIDKGTYKFTLANIISKEFKIENGSKIMWTGVPYEAVSDIKATYHQYVSFTPFITDSLTRNSYDAKRRYPVDLDLNLTGSILHPEFDMGITILDKYPSSLSSNVTAFRNTLATNPNELNRQVFSLILFKQFSPPNEFSGVEGAAQNFNELLSNQLSTWLSQVDPNLQIQVDVTQMSQSSSSNFNMRFSYTLLDGRLRVSMDGLVQGQNSSSSSSQSSSSSNMIGEWTVEYFLTENGKTKIKLFNRANQTSVMSNSNSTVSNSTGFSVTHTQEFDTIKEIFKNTKKEEEARKKKAEEDRKKQEAEEREINEILHRKDEELQPAENK